MALENSSVMCCPRSSQLQAGCGAFIQCDRGELGTLSPGTPVLATLTLSSEVPH